MIVFEQVKDFDLKDIFDCGQCFRWNASEDGSYEGIAGGNKARIWYRDETVYIDGMGDRNFWENYLALDMEYGEIKRRLSCDDMVRKAIDESQGIRLLRQEKWETIISFIISQNNNIPRIKGCIEKLCALAGEKIDEESYAFPTCKSLAELTAEDLAPVKLGYRASYIEKTAKTIYELGGEAYLEEIGKESDQDVYEFLRSLTGIGPKVADCIMLFGFERYGSFPIDVWVKRLMNRLYGFDENDVRGMKCFADETFGELGGFAQQYLFNYIRHIDQVKEHLKERQKTDKDT